MYINIDLKSKKFPYNKKDDHALRRPDFGLFSKFQMTIDYYLIPSLKTFLSWTS